MFTIVQTFNGNPTREIGNVPPANLSERLAVLRDAPLAVTVAPHASWCGSAGEGWGARAYIAAAHVPLVLAQGAYMTAHGELCVDGEIVEVTS